MARRRRKNGKASRGTKRRGKHQPGVTVRCCCGDVSAGPGLNYSHRDACPKWASLSHEERSAFLRGAATDE